MTNAATALDPFALIEASDDACTDRRTAGWVPPRALPRLAARFAPSAERESVETSQPAEGAPSAIVRVEPEPEEVRAELVVGPDLERAADYASAAWSENTKRAYRAQLKNWRRFCHDRGFSALPCLPTVLASYIAWRADGGTKPATIAIGLAAISGEHHRAGYAKPTDAPVVSETWKGVRRRMGCAPLQKAPLSPANITAMVACCDVSTLLGMRDVALLCVGFASAMRRSELVALSLGDVTFDERGATFLIRKSKTDQLSLGQHVAVTYGSDARTCPVRTLQRLIAALGITDPEAPIFTRCDHGLRHRTERAHDRMIARRIKVLAARAGLDASKFSGHSLRSGHATSASRAGRPLRGIQAQGRWSSLAMVGRYVRADELFGEDNSSRGLL